MTTLTLYRGDAEKIREFDFSKTCKYSLFGPGIYLTNKVTVADSYRTKGARASDPYHRVLFTGEAKNRTDAFEKAFPTFASDLHHETTGLWLNRGIDKASKKFLDMAQTRYRLLIEEKLIVANYTQAPTTVCGRYVNNATRLEVIYDRKKVVGYVTRFEFEEKPFSDSMIRIDRPIRDTTFWELMYDRKVKVGVAAPDRHAYVVVNSDSFAKAIDFGSSVRSDRLGTFRQIRHAVEPYGYRGFEYGGGLHIGGFGQHRAFVVWDDDYVNEHRVERFR